MSGAVVTPLDDCASQYIKLQPNNAYLTCIGAMNYWNKGVKRWALQVNASFPKWNTVKW